MDRFQFLGYLKRDELQRLQDAVSRFERACEAGRAVKIEAYLPPPGDTLRSIVLQELIKVQMEWRWRRGLQAYVDEYLEQFPELGTRRDVSAQLVYVEYRVRQQYGDRPALDGYQKRFPDQFSDLAQLVGSQPPPRSADQTSAPSTLIPSSKKEETPSVERDVVTVVGDYRKIRLLGKGAFGEAWLAEAPGGIEAVLKIIYRPLDQEESQRERQSLEIIKALHHPFLLQNHGAWVLEDRLVIAMELAEGSLRDRFKQCRKQGLPGIPANELLGYMRQSAEALDYLHSQNVQHRDIKPDNILYLKGYAKVADFGLARLLEHQSVQMTAGGTPAYMAPEVWRGRASKHSDQYALAATYVELRRGRRIHAGSGMLEAMVDHMEREPDLNDLTEAEQEVLRKALAKDPHARYPSCVEFVQALEQAVAPPPLPALVPTPWYGRLDVLIPAALVFSLLAAWGMAQLFRGDTAQFRLQASERLVRAGPPQTLHLQLQRLDTGEGRAFPEPIHLRFDTPPHVFLDEIDIPAGQGEASVRIHVGPSAATGTAALKVQATAASGRVYQVPDLELDLAPAAGSPVRGVRGEGVETSGGRRYYARLTLVLDEDLEVVFRFIPKVHSKDPPPFYLMENKVWNGLFGRFAASYKGRRPAYLPETLWLKEWRKGGQFGLGKPCDQGSRDPRLPVLRVHVEEAYRCAEWLGGNLPSVDQWDKAAGLGESPRGQGPFQGTWNVAAARSLGMAAGRPQLLPAPGVEAVTVAGGQLLRRLLAVDRQLEGPLPVGAALLDVSPFRCRDMAGNGKEWTRNLYISEKTVPLSRAPGANDVVLLRGESYRAHAPFQFDRLGTDRDYLYNILHYAKTDPETSFRVVLEPLF